MTRPIAAVRAESSLGVSIYVDELAHALERTGVTYRPTTTPVTGHSLHFHLANSSRRALWRRPIAGAPFAVTIHDVVPRTAALLPLYRALLPLVVRHAAVTIVHSRFAAALLARVGAIARQLEVIPHLAPAPAVISRAEARAALGWGDECPVFVLPGVQKPTKLVAEAIAAARPLIAARRLELVLVGPRSTPALDVRAREAGASLLAAPSVERYRATIAAADAVLVLRASSVGETNGPLLDALAAERPVLATRTGSIAEVAGGAATFCDSSVVGIRAGLDALLDCDERAERRAEAAHVVRRYRPETVARAHAELFAAVLDG